MKIFSRKKMLQRNETESVMFRISLPFSNEMLPFCSSHSSKFYNNIIIIRLFSWNRTRLCCCVELRVSVVCLVYFDFIDSFLLLLFAFTCRFSIVWLFCHFQEQPTQWYSRWDGMPCTVQHLYGLVSVGRPLYFADSKCTPCYLRCPIRSTAKREVNEKCQTISKETRKPNAYLAAGDWEIGENAIFFIFMARIRFQAFAFGIVPQLERVVKCCGQNVFAVRWEFDKWNRRIVIVDERFQALPRCRIPNTAQTIVAGRHN